MRGEGRKERRVQVTIGGLVGFGLTVYGLRVITGYRLRVVAGCCVLLVIRVTRVTGFTDM
jgi:hypothetical protein